MSRLAGTPKSPGSGIQAGQTWSVETVADQVWEALPDRWPGLTYDDVADTAGANGYTVRHYLRVWRRRRAVVSRLVDYDNGRRCLHYRRARRRTRRPAANSGQSGSVL